MEYCRNRYIVECKVKFEHLGCAHGKPVEIDTLWNVKLDEAARQITIAVVEIDTLWNVKKVLLRCLPAQGRVEIDTLWNVKCRVC